MTGDTTWSERNPCRGMASHDIIEKEVLKLVGIFDNDTKIIGYKSMVGKLYVVNR